MMPSAGFPTVGNSIYTGPARRVTTTTTTRGGVQKTKYTPTIKAEGTVAPLVPEIEKPIDGHIAPTTSIKRDGCRPFRGRDINSASPRNVNDSHPMPKHGSTRGTSQLSTTNIPTGNTAGNPNISNSNQLMTTPYSTQDGFDMRNTESDVKPKIKPEYSHFKASNQFQYFQFPERLPEGILLNTKNDTSIPEDQVKGENMPQSARYLGKLRRHKSGKLVLTVANDPSSTSSSSSPPSSISFEISEGSTIPCLQKLVSLNLKEGQMEILGDVQPQLSIVVPEFPYPVSL